ncbi:MAG: phosphodiester glycosidase family protein [Christensenellales bacterium]
MNSYDFKNVKSISVNVKKQKRMPVWAIVIIDLLLACCVLGIFTYYHMGLAEEEDDIPMVIVTPAPTPTSTPTTTQPVETADITPEPTIDPADMTWAQRFDAYFSENIVATDTMYRSPNISISIEKKTKGEGRKMITYFVADIYITKIECFQTYLAKGKYGNGRQDVLEMDIASDAVIAMTGDYYNSTNSKLRNVVIRNGYEYEIKNTSLEVCVLYNDGVMETFGRKEFNDKQVREAARERGIWQAWTFGPSLLDDEGKARTSFKYATAYQSGEHPRSAVGYYEPGHYCFVVVDGRAKGYSKGVNLVELAEIFEELGCKVGYNLDGGGSAVMTYDDKIVNRATDDDRNIGDCLLFKEVD